MLKKYLLTLMSALMLSVFAASAASAASLADTTADWEMYKQRFISPEGAVMDTYNQNISHSEGQGYGLMFALAYDDRQTFDKILSWTETHIANSANGLFYWSYRPAEADPTADKNNASDGDLFIAWTLLKAGLQWQNKEYIRKANVIAASLISKSTCTFANTFILLPGTTGFFNNTVVVVNPSYFIFPALSQFAQHTHLSSWQKLRDDSYNLLTRIQSMPVRIKVAPDWVEVGAAGQLAPAPQWPARSSYDAIRVPVYLFWMNPGDPNLEPWRQWFSSHQDGANPAWVNVTTGETAGYAMPQGLAAVRELVLRGNADSKTAISAEDDYYNASLKMLVRLAQMHF